MCIAVYEILTALELALPEEEIQKHVHSTQYEFGVFKNLDSFMSLCRHYLDKAVTLLFRNSTMQCFKGNVGCCLFQNTCIRPAMTAFDILSALMLSTYGAQTDPLGAPLNAKMCLKALFKELIGLPARNSPLTILNS